MQIHVLRKEDVAKDHESFKNLINEFCDQYYFENKNHIKKSDICQIMIDIFKDDFSDGFVRKNITNIDYKVKFRVRNAEKKGESKVQRFENDVLTLTYEALNLVKK